MFRSLNMCWTTVQRAFKLFMVRLIISCTMELGVSLQPLTTPDPSLSPSAYCPTSGVGKKCVHKCCLFDQHMRQKVCVPYNNVSDFSGLSVYTKSLKNTGRNVQDMFTVLPGKFVDDPKFRNTSMNRAQIGYMPYVLESGDVVLEKPNVYQRRIDIPNKDFCIEYVITKKGTLTKHPQLFVVVAGETNSVIVVNDNTTYLAVARWISCIFLLLVFLVYILLPELQNLGGLILMNYVASLFIAFLLLAVIQMDTYYTDTCIGLTCAIYYFFLASFSWMSVMSYDIWWTFRGYAKARPIHRRGERFKLFMYCLYAYGVPLSLTIFLYVVIVTDMKHVPWFITPQLVHTGCFLEGEAKMIYLYTPMLILIICNWLFYLMTAFNVWRLSRGTAVLDSAAAGSPAAHRSQMRRFMVYLKLSVVMGLSWLLEIISFIHPGYSMWYLSDTYNMLLGLVIFLIFVCKKKIYRKLYKRCTMDKTRSFHPGSSNSYSSNCSDTGPETVTLQVCGDPKGQNGFSNTIHS